MGASGSNPQRQDKDREIEQNHEPDSQRPSNSGNNVIVKDEFTHKAERDRINAANEIVYSLNVTLSCTEDGSKRERELGLTWVPATIADLQDEIQKNFNIPIFDQKLMFGPAVLSSKESMQSYSLRNGDSITVEYTSEVDVKEIVGVVSCVQKTLAFVESVQQQLFLFPIPSALQAQLQQNCDVIYAECDKFNDLYISSSPVKRIMNAQLFIHSGGLTCLQALHSLLLQLPFRLMTIHMQLLEIGMNRLLWTLSSCPEVETAVLKEMKWDNIVQSLCRVAVVPDAVIILPRNPYTDLHENLQMSVIVELLTNTAGCLSW